jgi:hypothetical protein
VKSRKWSPLRWVCAQQVEGPFCRHRQNDPSFGKERERDRVRETSHDPQAPKCCHRSRQYSAAASTRRRCAKGASTPMNDREKMFVEKFTSAAQYLGVTPDQVVSIKLRDSVASHSEYDEMLHALECEAGIRWSKIDGSLQGQGHFADHEGQKIIVVEHETGLEILFVAGSIASLIGLVPLVLQFWGAARGYLHHQHARHFHDIETRWLDADGHLQEDHSCGLGGPSAFPLSVVSTALSSAARILDGDISRLRNEVRALSDRVAAIEKQTGSRTKKAPPAANYAGKSAKRSRSKDARRPAKPRTAP